MKRAALVLAAIHTAAFAQFTGLATNDTGSQLLFTSNLTLAGGVPLTNFAVFSASGSAVQLVMAPTVNTPFSLLTQPSVSGAGTTVAFTGVGPCAPPAACPVASAPLGTVSTPSGSKLQLPGQVDVSRNGRYAVAFSGSGPTAQVFLFDLNTGGREPIAGAVVGLGREAVTSTGIVLTARQDGSLILTAHGAVTKLPNSRPAADAVVDDLASSVAYETAPSGGLRRLFRIDVNTGRETLVATARRSDQAAFEPMLSNDGRLLTFTDLDAAGTPQVFAVDRSGARRQITFGAGVREAVLAGSGNVVFAVTEAGSIVQVDVTTHAVTELVPRTPVPSGLSGPVVPGSVVTLQGTGLSAAPAFALTTPLPTSLGGVQVSMNGLIVPLVSVTPTGIQLQIPPVVTPGQTATFTVTSGNSPFLTPTVTGPVVTSAPRFYPTAVHGDFSGRITAQSPARPGEVVTVYMSGAGPVTPPVPAGAPAPISPLSTLVEPLRCTLAGGGQTADAEVLFAGLAPTFVGLYQVNVRLPTGLTSATGTADLTCGTPEGADTLQLPFAP